MFDDVFDEQLTIKYVCSKTEDERYCSHIIKKGWYCLGRCSLGHNPQDMAGRICPWMILLLL